MGTQTDFSLLFHVHVGGPSLVERGVSAGNREETGKK